MSENNEALQIIWQKFFDQHWNFKHYKAAYIVSTESEFTNEIFIQYRTGSQAS